MDYRKFEIHDFLADELFLEWVLSPTEGLNSFWEEWLSRNPDRRPVLEEARAIAEQIDFPEKWTATEKQDIWNYISDGIDRDEPGGGKRKFSGWYAVAASVTLLLGIWLYWSGSPEKVNTGYGEIRKVTLSDGTEVTLNANSQLTYDKRFSENPVREVWIRGEAFFRVASRKSGGRKVPFVVHTHELDVQVLGTAFNVANRRGRVDIALEHGSVKLVDPGNSDNTLMLKPGEKATRLAGRAPIQKEAVEIADYTGWTDGVVRYKSKSLGELAVMIEDAYDIEIIIENEHLRKETFTGTFPSDSVSVFFEKLEKLSPVNIVRKGKRYYLR